MKSNASTLEEVEKAFSPVVAEGRLLADEVSRSNIPITADIRAKLTNAMIVECTWEMISRAFREKHGTAKSPPMHAVQALEMLESPEFLEKIAKAISENSVIGALGDLGKEKAQEDAIVIGVKIAMDVLKQSEKENGK